MKRLATKAMLALAVMAVVCGIAAPASAAPSITQIQVLGPPGGWLTQPNGDGGVFNLYLYDQNGTLLNPAGSIDYSLPDGTYTLTLRGTDRADGPVFYLNLWFNGNPAAPDIAVSTASPLGSATVGGKAITVTSFTWLNGGQPDVASVDYPNAPDGYSDSVGQFNLEVHSEAPPPSSGPIHRWSGEGNADDAVGAANGTLGSTTAFAAGVAGQAFNFDAQQSSIVTLPVSINPDDLPQMTVGMWVKLRSRANDQGWVFGHDDGGYDRSLNLHDARYGYGVAGGTGTDPHYSPLQLSLNEWHFVAAAYDRNSATATFYADGAWYTVNANPGPGLPTTTLGGLALFANHTVDGLVDEVVLYDRVLTPQELDQIRGQITFHQNHPPVANAGPDQTMEGTGPLTSVTLNATSSADPDGDPLGYSWSENGNPVATGANPVLPLAQGSHIFTLTVDDGQGGTASDQVAINVVDTTPPAVTAALTLVSRSRDEDEDEDGNFYQVVAAATDLVDPHPTVSAQLSQPLTSNTPMAVSYKKEKKNRIQIQVEKKKLTVRLEGPSESALRTLWTQVLSVGGFAVSNGQQVQLVLKKDKGEYEAQYQFDKNLKLTSAKGPGLKLVVVATDAAGNRATTTAVPARSGDDDRRLSKRIAGMQPGSLSLSPNYPNPFNPSTTISYDLAEAAQVRLTIYNVMGQQVRELVAGSQEAGRYEVQWDGRDGRGQLVASGFYLYRLQAGDQVAVQKMLFAK